MADDEQPDPTADESGDETLLPSVDPQRPKRAENKRKREQREADEFWRGVLAGPIGRREMWRLFAAARIFERPFACGPNGFPQPEATWLAAGEQGFGFGLYLNLLALDPDGVRTMHLEHDSRFARFIDKGDR